jgi:mRNA-degrading endonuclease toxin of MazEF toxin-antitoxin module
MMYKYTGLNKSSKILCNYPHTIHKQLRLVKQLGIVNSETMMKVKKA